MAAVNGLPQEIWELIAAHLSRQELKKLMHLNRQLFNIVLDEKYRIVSWAKSNYGTFDVKKWGRLSNPAIASRVRCLHIRPWSLNELCGKYHTPLKGSGSSPQPQKPKPKSTLRKPLRFPPLPTSHDFERMLFQEADFSEQDKANLALMTKTMCFMTNVKALIIEWQNLPINSLTLSLLRNIPSSHPFNICILTLTSNLAKLRSLLPLLQAPQLEELNLRVGWDDFSRGDDHLTKENEAVLVDVLAPYLRSHASTLRSLRIVSHALGDHASFFAALLTLPRLGLLVLEISFFKDQLTNPQSLVDFLRSNASSLKNLEVTAQRAWEREQEIETQLNIAQFFDKLIQMDPWLPNLVSFWIDAPSASFSRHATESLLNRLPLTVTSVRLAHRCYTPSELISIVSIISSRVTVLYYLMIDVEKVPPPEVLKELSIKLPALWSLTFVIQKEDDSLRSLYRLGPRIEWNIHDLGVYYGSYRKTLSFLQGSLEPEKYHLGKDIYDCPPAPPGFERIEHSILLFLEEGIWKGKDGKDGVKSFNGMGHTKVVVGPVRRGRAP